MQCRTKLTLIGLGGLASVYVLLGVVNLKGPRRPIDAYVMPAECAGIESLTNAWKGSELECRDRINEKSRLQAFPGLVTRTGDAVSITYNQQPIANLVPFDHGDERCDTYSVGKVLRVYDTNAKALKPIVQVACFYGEFHNRFVVLPNGDHWPTYDAAASPSGHLIASGATDTRAEFFTIYDWPSLKPVARFTPHCRVIDWRKDDELLVTCLYQIGMRDDTSTYDYHRESIAFDAIVKKSTKGRWGMQTTRWLTVTGEYNTEGNLENAPSFYTLWPMWFSSTLK